MKLTANVKRRFEIEHRILDKLAKIMPLGVEQVGMSYPTVAEQIGEPVHAVLRAKQTMEDAGILSTRIDYPKGRSGRVGVWTMMVPLAEAHRAMDQEHKHQLERPSDKVVRQGNRGATGESILRYISGDDSELQPFEAIRGLRRDDAMALIEAARQYRNRVDFAAEKKRELEEQGIAVSPEAFAIQRDERLETISLVMSAIDSLVRERDKAEERAAHWSERVTDLIAERDEYKRKYEGAKRELERQVAARAAG